MKKKSVGAELILELSECDPDIIGQPAIIMQILEEVALKAGATIVKAFSHEFNPYGFTGGWILRESSIVAHTWPECRYVAVNLFTCGTDTNPDRARDLLIAAFRAQSFEAIIIPRGPKDNTQNMT